MTRKGFGFFFLLVAVSMVIFGCKKKDEGTEEVIPEVLSFTGPQDLVASGAEALEYSVAYRSGSSYEFTALNWPAIITVPDTVYPNVVQVIWQQADRDTSAYLVCVETSVTGNVSDPDSLYIVLRSFCSLDIDDFTGTWTGYTTGDSQDTLTIDIAADPSAGENTLRVFHIPDANAAGGAFLPPFMSTLFRSWGERFITGKGNEGDVLLHLDLISGDIVIENDYWGQTLPGPYNYWTGGEGTWSGCDTTMTINFELYWSTNYSSPNMTGLVEIQKQ